MFVENVKMKPEENEQLKKEELNISLKKIHQKKKLLIKLQNIIKLKGIIICLTKKK